MVGTAEVLAFEPDLMFSSRIEAASAKAGLHATITVDFEGFVQRLKDSSPDVIFLSLDASEGKLSTLEVFAKNGQFKFVGYYSHLNARLAEDARRVGIEVMTRGAFVAKLDGILRGLVSP